MRRWGMPSVHEIEADLRRTSFWQRWVPFAMPWLWAAGFVALWPTAWRWGCVPCLVLVFSACSTSTHDVVHGSVGLNRRTTEWLLFLLGAPILESGHAYRLTHLEHHRIFPITPTSRARRHTSQCGGCSWAGQRFCRVCGFGLGAGLVAILTNGGGS